MTNYSALGEYTAYAQQARDAAGRRFALMHNLANDLSRQADQIETVVNPDKIKAVIDDIAAADREMRAALERANQSAALCNKPALSIHSLSKF
ncbi:hypothetical protein [Aeromonas veronii]|uniref:hypothetical protein n=1 Tax=Aeromonas veronii TaxID=654 RepID=UPI001119D9F1|nr:hypothetical protein [Aeromonas veronii]TNI12714.1 hypothetical protein CF106_08410 [Aeromonas veronii]